MSLLNDKDMHEILQNSKLGLWRVEFEEGTAPRFFADAMMAEWSTTVKIESIS